MSKIITIITPFFGGVRVKYAAALVFAASKLCENEHSTTTLGNCNTPMLYEGEYLYVWRHIAYITSRLNAEGYVIVAFGNTGEVVP